jgi:hypothetical protein
VCPVACVFVRWGPCREAKAGEPHSSAAEDESGEARPEERDGDPDPGLSDVVLSDAMYFGLRPGSWVEKIQASLPVALCGRACSSFGTGGVTLPSSLAPGFIVQCPSNSAPSCTTKTGVVRLPKTLAPG